LRRDYTQQGWSRQRYS